ncbi:hypothetical protein EC9_07720 [Rosistilla ulvae]|uniref:LamG-like jellyroll fold domain-containing protein n=1 Tax=Rosistilla ulvae TaxID=1930277 RepID=A0A517LVF7_9BACT|nr:choice-of-anchor Q domain-containing protein [Rosistilla ulvae]QDS86600.1 hypothetical protein EC9_07720 [Rosistilla ulvae]
MRPRNFLFRKTSEKRIRSNLASRRRRLLVEAFEPRRLLTAYTVTTLEDIVAEDGLISLREAITAANDDAAVGDAEAGSGADSIVFSADVFPFTQLGISIFETLRLPGGEISITDDLSIRGPGRDAIHVSGDNSTSFFNIAGGVNVSISDLTFTNGRSDSGGAFTVAGTLNLDDVAIINSSANAGGAIDVLAAGTLKVENSLFRNNSADAGDGGAIRSLGSVTVESTRMEDNLARVGDGGAIFAQGILSVKQGVFYTNEAEDGGAIWHTGGLASVATSEFRSNESRNDGAGIYSNAAADTNLELANSTLILNTAGRTGGGLFVGTGATTTVTSSKFQLNTATAGSGGGMAVFGQADVIDSSILLNNARANGGGLILSGASAKAKFVDSAISENASDNSGGGAYVFAGLLDVQDSQIMSNTGHTGAGGLFIDRADLKMQTTTVGANIASQSSLANIENFGGGIAIRPGVNTRTRVESSAIVDNTADDGGGIFILSPLNSTDGSELALVTIGNTTVSGNHARSDIGGIVIDPATKQQLYVEIVHSSIVGNTAADVQGGLFSSTGAFRLDRSILVDNADVSILPGFDLTIGAMDYRPVSNLIESHNDLSSLPVDQQTWFDSAPGAPDPATEPLINRVTGSSDHGVLARAFNGGATVSHGLAPTSPALNNASVRGTDPNDARAATRYLTDQRGEKRTGTGTGSAADIGAFEANVILSSTDFKWSDQSSQFSSADAFIFGAGFNLSPQSAQEQASGGRLSEPEFLGFEFDTGQRSFGKDFGIVSAEVTYGVSGRFGIEYGYYVNAGSVDLSYDGNVDYSIVRDQATGGYIVGTELNIDDGLLYTISPTFGAYADLIMEMDLNFEGKGCISVIRESCFESALPPINIDQSVPLFSVNKPVVDDDGYVVFKEVGEGNFVPELDGNIAYIGTSIKDNFNIADDLVNEIKGHQNDATKAEIDKKKAETDLKNAKTSAERNAAKGRIVAADTAAATAKAAADDSSKTTSSKSKISAKSLIGVDFGQTDGQLGGEVTLTVNEPAGILGKRVGSMALTLPDIRLVDDKPESAENSFELSATTDDFLAGSDAEADRQLAKLSVDIAGVIGPMVGIPAGEFNIGLGSFLSASLTTISYNIEPKLKINQDISAKPIWRDTASFAFNQDVLVEVNGQRATSPSGDGIFTTTEVFSFTPGDTIKILPVSGGEFAEDLEVTPALQLGASISNDIGLDIDVDGVLEALKLGFTLFGNSLPTIGPLIRHEHDIVDVELGSIFDTTFTRDAKSVEFQLPAGQGSVPKLMLEKFTAAAGEAGSGQSIDTPLFLSDTATTVLAQDISPDGLVYVAVPLERLNEFVTELQIRVTENQINSIGVFQNGLLGDADGTALELESGRLESFAPATSIGLSNIGKADLINDGKFALVVLQVQNPSSSVTLSATPIDSIAISNPNALAEFLRTEGFNDAAIEQSNLEFIANDGAIDIDGNGVVLASSDGQLIVRYLQGLRGDALIENVIGKDATRTDAATIEAYFVTLLGEPAAALIGPLTRLQAEGELTAAQSRLDVDGNGFLEAEFDGVLIQRSMGGFQGNALIAGALGVGATRTDPVEIMNFIDGFRDTLGDVDFDSVEQYLGEEAGFLGFEGAFKVQPGAVDGSSPFNPIRFNTVGNSGFRLTPATFGETVSYETAYLIDAADPDIRYELSKSADLTPTRAGTSLVSGDIPAGQLRDLTGPNNSGRDRVALETTQGQLGVDESIWLELPDRLGYQFEASAGHTFTELEFDTNAGDGELFFHEDPGIVGVDENCLGCDQFDEFADYDVFVPATNQWFAFSMDAGFVFPQPVTQFLLYARDLVDPSISSTLLNNAQAITQRIGFRFAGPDSSAPTIDGLSIGDRLTSVVPDQIFASETATAPTTFKIVRNGTDPVVTSTIGNAAPQTERLRSQRAEDVLGLVPSGDSFPLASLRSATFSGSEDFGDTLVVDHRAGAVFPTIGFAGDFDPNGETGTGDVLKIIGDGVFVDITDFEAYQILDVEVVDIREGGSNTLFLDGGSIHDNSARDAEGNTALIVMADADDLVDKGPGWVQLADQQLTVQGNSFTFNVYSQFGVLLKISNINGPPQAAAPAIAPPIFQNLAGTNAEGELIVATSEEFTPTQAVTVTPQVTQVEALDTISLDVSYAVLDPSEALPNSLHLLIHYDSSRLSFTGQRDLLADGLLVVGDMFETNPDDNGATDRMINVIWTKDQGVWPTNGATLADLLKLDFDVLGEVGETTVTVTGFASADYEFSGNEIVIDVLPKNFVVDLATDEDDGNVTAGDVSLREALQLAGNAGVASIVTFDPALAGVELILTEGPLVPAGEVTLAGLGADKTIISGNNVQQIMTIAEDVSVTLQDLALINGATAPNSFMGGAAIDNNGALRIERTWLNNNNADGNGGAIANGSQSDVYIIDSTISNNSATSFGGAIQHFGTRMFISGSTISGNRTRAVGLGSGGAIAVLGGALAIDRSTITGNSLPGGGVGAGIANGFAARGANEILLTNSVVAGNFISDNPNSLEFDESLFEDIGGVFSPASLNNFIGSDALFDTMIDDGINGNRVGTAEAPLDPMLGSLQINGGSLPTHLPLAGSPLIDAASRITIWEDSVNASEPQHWWRLAEQLGEQTAIATVGGLDGLYIGQDANFEDFSKGVPAGVVGRSFDTAIEFGAGSINETSAGFIEVTPSGDPAADVLPAEAFSIEAWIFNARAFDDGGSIISAGIDDLGSEAGWALSQFQNGIEFRVTTTDGTVRVVADNTNSVFENDIWTHVTATYDGANAKLYIASHEAVSVPLTGPIDYPAVGTGGGVVIGAKRDANTFIQYDGVIDEVIIYDHALSQQEITRHASSQFGAAVGIPSSDQRGFSRKAGDATDIGSVEVGPEPGFRVLEGPSSSVTEGGASASFGVVLDAPPAKSVTIRVERSAINSASDKNGASGEAGAPLARSEFEAEAIFQEFIFTPFNWNQPQTVRIDPVDDARVDGTREVSFGVSIDQQKSDVAFSNLAKQFVTIEAIDNEVAGFTVVESDGFSRTTEAGGRDTLTITLNGQPSGSVIIDIASANPREVAVETQSVTFTPTNWNIPKTVTVVGVDDDQNDGDQSVDVSFSVNAGQSHAAFANVPVQTIAVINANVAELDFGDAPTAAQSGFAADYPVTLAQNGARHSVGLLFLGSGVDAEANGLPSLNSDGDDNNGSADEDGVFVVADMVAVTGSSTTSSFSVTASAVGKLDAWIDFNQDGDWNDSGEQIFIARNVVAGQNLFSFTVPAGVSAGDTGARFRLSSTGGLAPTGAASDGEVEDYIATILDGDAAGGADISIEPPTAGTIDITNEGSDIVFRRGAIDLFKAPGNKVRTANIVGTDGDDTINLSNVDAIFAGTIRSDGADGNDRLNLTGENQDIDLTLLANDAIGGFETIDIRGEGANRLSLSRSNVLSMAIADDELTILMDPDDRLDTNNDGFSVTATEVVDGVFGTIATSGSATLKIHGAGWTNPLNRNDVNASGTVTPLDALVILNELARRSVLVAQSSVLIDPSTVNPHPLKFYDTTGDGLLAPLDALRVLNFLNRGSAVGEAPFAILPPPTVTESKDDNDEEQWLLIEPETLTGDQD